MAGVTMFFLIFAGQVQTPGLKLFFNMISYLSMTLTVGTGYILMQSMGVQSNMTSMVSYLMWIVGIVLGLIMFFIMITQTFNAIESMRNKKYGDYDDI